jgi:RNA polymerase sigma factor (sigma-70 family)
MIERREIQGMLMERIDWLHGLVRKRIPAEHAAIVSADDIVQEVCMAAFLHASRMRSPDVRSFESWLATTARSKLADALRSQSRLKRGGGRRIYRAGDKQRSSLVDLFARLHTPCRSPSRTISDREAIYAMTMALSRLPVNERTAVHMKYIEGRSRSEIAAVMDKSDSQVKRCLSRGLRTLRTQLGDAYRLLSDDRSVDSQDGKCERRRNRK